MQHWVFDFDGTLVDSEGFFAKSFKYALEPFSIEVETDFIERIRHKHPHRIFEDYLDDQQSKIALSRLIEASRDSWNHTKLFPGMENLLQTLLSRGSTVSVWTGRDGESTRTILKTLGVADLFSQVVSGTCVPNNKPSLDGLLQIQKVHQANGDQMVMVGDHHHDIEPANKFGCLSIHARWKRNPVELPEEVQPKLQFNQIVDFQNWLEQNLLLK